MAGIDPHDVEALEYRSCAARWTKLRRFKVPG